jgi:hypothetical protein
MHREETPVQASTNIAIRTVAIPSAGRRQYTRRQDGDAAEVSSLDALTDRSGLANDPLFSIGPQYKFVLLTESPHRLLHSG